VSPAGRHGPAVGLSGAATERVRQVMASEGRGGTVTGVGVDAVEVERFRRVLARRPPLARRLFTPGELGYAGRAADPVPRLSTRFAAKEAVMKALGVGLGAFAFTEVEVVRVGLGAPTLVLHGAAADRAHRGGVVHCHLSLTHTAQVALALVVAEGHPDQWPGPSDASGPSGRSADPATKP
jgi:holo-[acyl-carrier protein] synthase